MTIKLKDIRKKFPKAKKILGTAEILGMGREMDTHACVVEMKNGKTKLIVTNQGNIEEADRFFLEITISQYADATGEAVGLLALLSS